MLFTIISLLCVDRAGRRKFLLGGTTLMCVGIVTLGIMSNYLPAHTKQPCDIHQGYVLPMPHNHSFVQQPQILNKPSTHNILNLMKNSSAINVKDHKSKRIFSGTVTTLTPNSDLKIEEVHKWLAIVALMVFVAGYAIGFGPGNT